MTSDPLRLGVAGLGRAFMLMIPTFEADPRVRLVAAAAPRAESRAAFERDYGGKGYENVEALCANPDVEAVYIATPHQMHVDHVLAAARAGKHILVEKPLAISMVDADRMVDAARTAGVHLIVGPSHSFDLPVHLAARLIASGEFGALRMIQALNYTDFLYRPRRPEELRTEEGGGVMFSQAIHQIDVVRRLAGGMADRVVAFTGNWDSKRPTEGAFTALMSFATGCVANLTYSGYAHFDSDIWMNNVGELGQVKNPGSYGKARRTLMDLDPEAEARLKSTRTFGSGAAMIEALFRAVRENVAPVQTGEWGLASLEVCHAILRSAETGQPVALQRQCNARQ